MNRTVLVTIALTLALAPFVGRAETINKYFISSLYDRVEVETFNGEITATATPGEQITLTFEPSLGKYVTDEVAEALSGLVDLAKSYVDLDDVDITFDEDKANRVLRVKVEMPDDDNDNVEGVSVKLSVPSSIFLKLTTLNGDISIDGSQKGFELVSTNGNLTMDNTAGQGSFNATNGNVVIDGHQGNVTGIVTNGDITGKIDLPDRNCVCELETVNDDIEIGVPSTVGAKVMLSTVHGTTRIQGFDADAARVDDDISKTIGDGSGFIRLESTNGNVTLKAM